MFKTLSIATVTLVLGLAVAQIAEACGGGGGYVSYWPPVPAVKASPGTVGGSVPYRAYSYEPGWSGYRAPSYGGSYWGGYSGGVRSTATLPKMDPRKQNGTY